MLDPIFCRQRQRRLLDIIAKQNLDAVVCAAPHHVYYFSGFLPDWRHHVAFILRDDGRSTLICPNRAIPSTALDDTISYEANWAGTLRQEQPAVIAQILVDSLKSSTRIAIDSGATTAEFALRFSGKISNIEEDLWQMRRRKDPDELALMRRAIHCTRAMYDRAKSILTPGIFELEVFNQLHAAAVESAQEPLAAMLGNDFRCGAGGGSARHDRKAKEGELYILDLGPNYRGYFADNARTFSVDRAPTDEQLRAWEIVAGAIRLVESVAKPRVKCRELYHLVDQHFRSALDDGLPHHLGHGVGLQPHEFPHLNPKWDDTLLEGEIFTAEPGIYAKNLAAGIRIENQYLVTSTGIENLVDFPVELA